MNLAERFKDNCGFGLLAQIRNQPSHQLLQDAIQALSRMMHRGAVSADGKTGDGCGLLCSMPVTFMRKVAEQQGLSLPEQFAVATLFLSEEQRQLDIFREQCEQNDLNILLVREVPLNTDALGEYALQMLPKIVQVFVAPAALIATRRFDALLYLTRKEVERRLADAPDFYIPCFSRSLVSYKGLVMPHYIAKLFPDLQNEDFQISFAMFHQRFSTNTLPQWRLAQPLRNIAHNGEINSIQGNRFKAQNKFTGAESPNFSKQELELLQPILQNGVSDSANLDNMVEFLLANGVDFFKAIRALIPPARHNVANMPAKLRAFYEYNSAAFEPWDGPAAVSITNGRYIGCVLDRNGLRPAKYVITTDDRLLITSEYGVLGTPPEKVRERGRLQSGEMIAADLKHGKIFYPRDIDRYLMESQPYNQWLTEHTHYLQEFIGRQFEDLSDYRYQDLETLQRYHNVTSELVDLIIRPMMLDGKEPVGSMGDDCPPAAFSEQQRSFSDFFKQKFAQVTNPPIDPLREKAVMSTTIGFGGIGNPLLEAKDRAKRLKSISPILSNDIFQALLSFGDPELPRFEPCYKHRSFSTSYAGKLKLSLEKLGEEILNAVVNDAIRVIILDDRDLSREKKIIPMALAVGYINQQLLKGQLRQQVTIVACTAEVLESHSACVLIGYGAVAIYPWLLYATGVQLCEKKEMAHKEIREQLKNIYDALTKGILKVMSKMGISTVSSYRNAALFDIIGLSKQLVASCFPGSAALLPGLDFEDLETRIDKIHRKVFAESFMLPVYPLEIGGYYSDNPGFEYHDFNSKVVTQLHRFAEVRSRDEYLNFRKLIDGRGFRFIRDGLTFNSPNKPIMLEDVEPVEAITRRFDSAAMSLGALSPEAHEALAEAMNILGGSSNCGEGGEDAARFKTVKNSKIKQIASGRFGVTPGYLRNAEEIQIKLAQGAKPGEGGQLPGEKVTPLIASLRFTVPGVTLISPPPHHDIYSIEDLAQLIFDLKQVNPEATISVKLVSSEGVGTIAAGVAKAYADKIIISGGDGGTGAAPFSSIKAAGNPWELGLAEAHLSLKANNLRELVELQTDGGLKIGRDVVKAAMLGAEEFGFGTPLLVILGCKILRVCHLNRCTVGIATQDESLRGHYTGTVEKVVSYLRNVAEDVREILAELGFKSLEEVIGRSDLLKQLDDPFVQKFDYSQILQQFEGNNTKQKPNPPFDDNAFEKELLEEVIPVIRDPKMELVVERQIINTNRSFGTLISGAIARYYGDKGLPKEALTIKLTGVAGQSLGAFLTPGVNILLTGVGNDYVGKGMHDGRIIITPAIYQEGASAVGNTCLYGATGGKLFVSGTAGERFGVRNSGALAVVEGTGDHACEYMTGGTVVVLGDTGINFAAGMTGGVAFVYDRQKKFIDRLNQELVIARRIDVDDDNEGKLYLKKILTSFHNRTSSPKAKRILDDFREELAYFWMVTPKDMKAPLNPKEGD
ncbi:glutamate synthase large subunit [Malonomonas rubra]|uniref:glutamate synthase large subunit n=1 Tax=Malonomonas rubra TaxID=57040 RepID=UPI0026F2791D|nr:glutamate synthase large subunit [Malonomonas rubra]